MNVAIKLAWLSRQALLVCIVIVLSYYAALLLPVSFGAENGVIESTQVSLLLLGGMWCLVCWAKCTSPRWRAFWLMIGPLWLILALQELSWGAVFLEPVSISEVLGSTFPSSKQLWYKPAVAPAIGFVLICCFWIFIRTRQHLSIKELAKNRQLPFLELVICSIFMIVSAAAEGHLGVPMSMGAGASQVFEEMVELWAYLALLLAQYRVVKGSSRY